MAPIPWLWHLKRRLCQSKPIWFKSGPPTILHERRMAMFNVRIKNSKLIYTVYAIDESDTGDLIFLVFDTVDQIWFWELANNCVPA